jgi:hypothetical protein
MNNNKGVREMRQVIPLPWSVAEIAGESRPLPAIALRCKAPRLGVAPACAALLFAAISSPAFGQSSVGLVGGVTRDSSTGKPVAKVQIIAHNLDKDTDRTAISDADGIFTFTNLEPGPYEVAATKDGFEKSSAQVEVADRRVTRVELPLQSEADLRQTLDRLDKLPLTDREKQLLDRVDLLEQRLAAMEGATEGKDSAATPALAKNTPSTDPLTQEAALTPNAALPPDAPVPPAPPAPAPAPAPSPNPQQAAAAPPAQAGAAAAVPTVDNDTPFADYDWTWLNGNPRNKDVAYDSKFFTPEIRADITYTYDFNKPIDDSMGGSSELFRSNEIQLEQFGLGGDFHLDNVRARFMTQFGEYSEATIRNDATPAKGQWNLNDADRYLAEAYGGYHVNWMHGMNIDAGIFMSYVGLFSYYNFDNWAYQPSYVSSNTPWFFEGIRIQIFPTHHLKIEPWIINGWQSYASANTRKGIGGQIKWTPFPWMNIVSNEYAVGHDDLYVPNRGRIHTDNSIEIKYYDHPERALNKMAFTFTGDLGCEFGEGVSCHNDSHGNPKQSFIGYMLYNRFWFGKMFALTPGGGQINNPGRYLVLIPPINGETASSAAINSPYFTFNPGDPFKAWDTSLTFDIMPTQWITWRFEGDYRHASVPYWAGRGGMTPPPGTNNNFPTQYACMDGTASGSTTLTQGLCANDGGVWYPDLRRDEMLFDIDLMVKF